MEITPGCVVQSRAGHDRGRIYAVLEITGSIAQVSDGVYRKLTDPKKKNVRHLAYLGKLDTADAKSLESLVVDREYGKQITMTDDKLYISERPKDIAKVSGILQETIVIKGGE